jgi:hypothetical protein
MAQGKARFHRRSRMSRYHLGFGRLDVSSVQRAALCLVGVFLLAYLPDLGHGLVRDDFGWIRHSRLVDGRTFADLFQANVGFYRPLVMVSFALDYSVWGIRPFGYGLTNLAIVIVNAVLVYILARRLALPPAAALLAAAVWALNFHGINVSLLWLSGRTALMVTLFSLLAAIEFIARRQVSTGVFTLMAMLCKEEAVVLPALFSAVAFFEEGGWRAPAAGVAGALRRVWPVWLALAIYFPLRFNSGAFDASSAPTYYTFSLSPGIVLRNLREYLDRAGTVAILVSLAMLIAARVWGRRSEPTGLNDAERRALVWTAMWVPACFALTLFLPLRSSLYIVLPSAGAAVAAGAVASRTMRLASAAFTRVAIALILVALACVPVYRARNRGMVRQAALASRTMAAIGQETQRNPQGGVVAFIDNRAAETTFEASFGGAVDDAVVIMNGTRWRGLSWSADDPLPDTVTLAVRLQPDGSVTVGPGR